MSQSTNFLNTTDVAKFLNCSQKNVQRLIREFQIIPLNPQHSRGYLFDVTHIQEFANKRKEAQNA